MKAPVRVDGQARRPKLPRMAARRSHRTACTFRVVTVAATIALSWGCRNDKPPARIDTSFTAVPGHLDSTSAPTSTNGWDVAAGPVLLVAGPSPDEAVVFFGAGGGATAPLDTGAVDQATAGNYPLLPGTTLTPSDDAPASAVVLVMCPPSARIDTSPAPLSTMFAF